MRHPRHGTHALEHWLKRRKPLPAKLIFNPSSGNAAESHAQLAEIITQLQSVNILPEVYLVQPDVDLALVARQAVERGLELVIAAGGDGTIDAAIGGLVGTSARLGIIPTGTQNNTARTLGIPLNNYAAATRILRDGRKLRVDVAQARRGADRRWFLEAASAGLISALFPAADDIQHGSYSRIADLLATLIRSQPSRLRMKLIQESGCQTISTQAHVVLVSNLPYIGAQYRPSEDISYTDGLLDVFVFANLDKLDLIGYAVQAMTGATEDPRVSHYQVRSAVIYTDPPMPVLADGFPMGEGTLKVASFPQALYVMASRAALPGSATRQFILKQRVRLHVRRIP